jgi:hypothetical protein
MGHQHVAMQGGSPPNAVSKEIAPLTSRSQHLSQCGSRFGSSEQLGNCDHEIAPTLKAISADENGSGMA